MSKLLIRRAVRSDRKACTILARDAFRTYPFFSVYGDDPRFYDALMRIWVRNGFRHGTVLVGVEDGQVVAVAMLKAPHDREILFRDASLDTLRLYRAVGRKNAAAFFAMCARSDAACHALPSPKWHLSMLAVSPAQHGKGLGSAMLWQGVVPCLRADGGGLLTFNTNTEVNRAFYQRNGFTEFDDVPIVENGVTLGNWSFRLEV